MKKNNQNWIESIEEQLRAGNGRQVRHQLEHLKRQGVKSNQILSVARIARRVGMYHFATNILFPKLKNTSSDEHLYFIVEYAICCVATGNYLEAIELFNTLPSDLLKNYANYYLDSLFHAWEYEKACSFLSKIMPTKLDDYNDLILALNYTATLVQLDQQSNARSFAEKLLPISKKNGLKIIEANTLELMGQIHFNSQEWSHAKNCFLKSEKMLRGSNNISWLYSSKWLAIVNLVIHGPTPETLSKIEHIRELARQFLHWETLRDCDLYESIYTHNEQLFSKVYYGTPHLMYRKRALQISGGKFKRNPEVLLGSRTNDMTFGLDLSKGDFNNDSCPLHTNLRKRKLITALAKDLYRPLSIYETFRTVFEEKLFNPQTSKDRAYKAIRSLKDLLRSHPSGCNITSKKSYGYRLRSGSNTNLLLIYPQTLNEVTITSENLIIEDIKEVFGDQSFTRNNFCTALSLPSRSGSRKLKSLLHEGKIEKIGAGSQTKYKIL